jgi:hypothetical protein
MKMKRYIAAGILATALLASGCGKFVRDELITMQNEIDQLTKKVSQMMNEDLAALSEVVTQMENGGYVTSAETFTDEEGRSGIVLTFNNNKTLSLYHGADGKDGADAVGPAIFPQWDEEAGHYYWAVKNEGDEEFSWLLADGERVQAGAVDGKTPKVKIEEGFWWLSPDGSEEGYVKQDWPVSIKGQDADQIFSLDYEVYDDRIVLVLSQTGETLVIPRFIPIDLELTLEGQELEGDVLIAPGETLSIQYSLSGTGAKDALLVAGTDGRFKTALREETSTEEEGAVVVTGIVDVICPEVFPEGGYIYITVNDGNGCSQVRVIRFVQRTCKLVEGELEYKVAAEGETGHKVSFEANFEVDVIPPVFPEGVEPWLANVSVQENVLTYDILPNTGADERKFVLQLVPKDHPGFEMFQVAVIQAGVPAPPSEGTGSGE